MENLNQQLKTWKGKKVLMAIYPHPDDETMASGGLLMVAKQLGWKTVVVILTQGGAGQVHIHARGRSLKNIRQEELARAAKILQVDELVVGDFGDGKLRAEQAKWTKWLIGLIEKHAPSIVVTYDHSGISGHPDHIVLSRVLSKIVTKFRLLCTCLPPDLARMIVREDVRDFVAPPTHVLNFGGLWLKKWLAARAHKSQALGKSLPAPLPLVFAKYHYEWYHEVKSGTKYKYKFVDFKI